MQPVRIGLDFDGVIVDHHPHKLRLAGEMGIPLERWQANSNVLKGTMSHETYERLQTAIYGDMTKDAPPVAGALESIARLQGEIYIISARRAENEDSARAWMAAHGLFNVIPPSHLFFCREGKEKRAHCERIGLSIFLDDKLSYLEHLSAEMRRVLFDVDGVASRLDVPSDVLVADSWKAFLALAEE